MSQPETSGTLPSPSRDELNETYAVYNALLADQSSTRVSKSPRPIAIEEHTSANQICIEQISRFDSTGRDFIEKNKKGALLLASRFSLGRKVRLISESEMKNLFAKDINEGWRTFHNNYPGFGGIVTLSAVGFNAERNLAIVSSGFQGAPLFGNGGLHTFAKKDGVWRETSGPSCSWIS